MRKTEYKIKEIVSGYRDIVVRAMPELYYGTDDLYRVYMRLAFDNPIEKDVMQKPPLGLKPKHIHDTQRKQEVKEAVIRYLEAGKEIPREWIDEHNSLVRNDSFDPEEYYKANSKLYKRITEQFKRRGIL